MTRSPLGEVSGYGIRDTYGVWDAYGVQENFGQGGEGLPHPSALTSTLTASAPSFATNASVTLTFTARDAASNLVVGYTPVPESGVVS